jgi:hypothetical protein
MIVKASLTLSTGDTNLQVQALTVLNELLKRPENAVHVVNYGYLLTSLLPIGIFGYSCYPISNNRCIR